jgi:hypothetical protein
MSMLWILTGDLGIGNIINVSVPSIVLKGKINNNIESNI